MELILKETIDSLGREGDIVKVKPGFGRNFLLPKGKAVAANAANRAVLEKNQAVILARLEKDQKKNAALESHILLVRVREKDSTAMQP